METDDIPIFEEGRDMKLPPVSDHCPAKHRRNITISHIESVLREYAVKLDENGRMKKS
jgi:hypothetical protein